MYTKKFLQSLQNDLQAVTDNGKFKVERVIEGPQGAHIVANGKPMLMFASNNYLGLSNHPEIIASAKKGLDEYGFGMASVRFLSGTQTIHKELEKRIAKFIGTEEAIVYSTNFMSNLGIFATIVNEPLGETAPYKDVIYSDTLNHASIIDAFKLCKKELVDKRIYPHADLKTLETFLEEDASAGSAQGSNKRYRNKIIVTDGVFSMEGDTAKLKDLLALAEKYEALLFVDDAHGIGVMGENGRGTPEAEGLLGQIDIISGTLGKALGGAIGGYIGGKKELIDLLRQKSRTYLFSNALPASVALAGITAIDILERDQTLIKKVKENANYFRAKLAENNLPTLPGNHPIVPLMIGDAKKTSEISKKLFDEGIYATGMSFPVVPEGEARIRFQLSALHTKEDIDEVVEKIVKAYN